MSGFVEREAIAVGRRDVDRAHAVLRARLAVDHLERLAAEILAQHRAASGAQRRLVDVEFIRIDRALHDRLAQTIRGGDEHHVAKAGVGVEREHDAGAAEIAAHHVLNADGERDRAMIEIVVHAVGYGAVVEQRGIHFVHAGHQMLLAAHVQESLLLSGKRCLRQIFGGRRGTDRDGELAPDRRSPCPSCARRRGSRLQPLRERRGEHPAADLRADHREPLHVIDVERRQDVADALIEPVLREEVPIRMRGRREPAGHRDAESRQSGDHFADGRILAADEFNVFVLQLLEGNDVGLHGALLVGVGLSETLCRRRCANT